MTEDLEILQGAISAVVYQNYENGYAVLRLNVGGGQNVTVVGTIPLPAVGERLMVTGKWSTHSSYGRQFEAEFLERLMPQTSLEILNYLSSRIIKGIGPKTAARIVEHFGEQTLLVMEREPERLAEVPGISREKAKAMGEEFRLQVGMRQLMEFFAVHHLPAELAVRMRAAIKRNVNHECDGCGEAALGRLRFRYTRRGNQFFVSEIWIMEEEQ